MEATLSALPRDIRASFERIVHLIEAQGLTLMREPYIKHLEGPVWEMRMKSKDRCSCRLYLRDRAPRCGRAYVSQKDTEDATPRN